MLSATLGVLNRQSEWIATLGRKTAAERVCALLSEISQRLRDSGRAFGNQFPMPLTQADIADIVGMTPVHVNRVLKQLRLGGLIQLDAKRLHISDPAKVFAIGAGSASLEAR